MVADLAPPVLASTRYVTDPLPEPLAAEVIVSQLLLSRAVQAHPAAVLMRIVPVDSSAPTLSESGEILNAQVGDGGGAGVGPGPGGGAGAGEGVGVGPGVGVSAAAAC
jgi:hypothetical protein